MVIESLKRGRLARKRIRITYNTANDNTGRKREKREKKQSIICIFGSYIAFVTYSQMCDKCGFQFYWMFWYCCCFCHIGIDILYVLCFTLASASTCALKSTIMIHELRFIRFSVEMSVFVFCPLPGTIKPSHNDNNTINPHRRRIETIDNFRANSSRTRRKLHFNWTINIILSIV